MSGDFEAFSWKGEFIVKAEPLYDVCREGISETTDITDRITDYMSISSLEKCCILGGIQCAAQYSPGGRDGRCDLTHEKRINNENKRLLKMPELVFSRCTCGQKSTE